METIVFFLLKSRFYPRNSLPHQAIKTLGDYTMPNYKYQVMPWVNDFLQEKLKGWEEYLAKNKIQRFIIEDRKRIHNGFINIFLIWENVKQLDLDSLFWSERTENIQLANETILVLVKSWSQLHTFVSNKDNIFMSQRKFNILQFLW